MAGAVAGGYTPPRPEALAYLQQQPSYRPGSAYTADYINSLYDNRPQSSPATDGLQYSPASGYGIQATQAYGGGGITPGGVGGGMPIPTSGYLSGQQLGQTAAASGGVQSGGGLSQSAYEAQQQEQLQAKLSQEAFDRRLAAFRSTQSGGPSARVEHDSSGQEALARANAFAQAKEKAGLNAQAALQSLRGLMGATGRAGSSQEMDRAYDILGTGRSDVNTFINKQLESDLGRAAQVSDLIYQGGITQRGQDMSQGNPILGLLTAGRLY